MARTSAFFGSVKPKAFCQKRLKLSFPAPFFFGSFLFGRTKRNEHKKKEGASLGRSVEIVCIKRIASPSAQRSRGRYYQTKSRCRS